MSHPILYSATETNFDHNGIGILSACVSCEVTEEANGAFELVMKYPADGIHFDEIQCRSIIRAKSDQFRNSQLFRVYKISKPSLNGVVNIYAEHISYDLSGIPVKPFSAQSAASALAGLKTNAIVECPFDFWTDKETQAQFSMSAPASVRFCLGGMDGSILSVYRGEYEFDNYTVKLHNNRGLNRGVSIRYGKNLTDIKQDENCSNIVTGVYPYWKAVEGEGYVELPEKVINTPGTHDFVKVNVLDFSQVFQEQPTEEQLREYTKKYIETHELGIPIVSLTVSFAQLAQSDEYKNISLLERVSLCDTVNVEFPALGVSATAKAVKLVYDVIADRVKSVTLGSVRANIADTIVEQQKEIAKIPNKTFLERAVEGLTNSILGAKGGSVRLLDENGDGEPDTLYIADNPDPTQAVKVWRFNYEGWGASENGYGGPFRLGATLKDGIVADFITTGILSANLIKTGTLDASLLNVINLLAEKLRSVSEQSSLDIDGASMTLSHNGRKTFETYNYEDGTARLYFYDKNGNLCINFGDGFLGMGKNAGSLPDVYIASRRPSAGSILQIDEIASNDDDNAPQFKFLGKQVFWEDNGDGTYSLIGQ